MAILDANTFGIAMDKLKLAAREGLVHPDHGTLSYQGRKLLERILTLTPAHGSDPATQQYIAIRTDVLKLVQLMPPIVMQAIEKLPQGRRLDGWLHDSSLGVHLRMNAAGYIRTPDQLRAIHRRQYTPRGRVIGLPPGARYYISPFVLGAYLEHTMNPMAGKAKAGWLPAATRLFVAKLPRYAFRHSPGSGYFTDGRQAPRPFIEARNTTRWARGGYEAQRIVNNAIASRTRDMERYFALRMQGAVGKAGLAA